MPKRKSSRSLPVKLGRQIHQKSKKRSKKKGRPIEAFRNIRNLFLTPKSSKPKKSIRSRKSSKAKSKSKSKTRTKTLRSMSGRTGSTGSTGSTGGNVVVSPAMAKSLGISARYLTPSGHANVPSHILDSYVQKQLNKELKRLEQGQLKHNNPFIKKTRTKSKRTKSLKPKFYTPRIQVLEQEIQLLKQEVKDMKKHIKHNSPPKPRRIQPMLIRP